jgi:type IV secretion system protein VirB10
MPETNQNPPATVPDQPEAKSPVRKGMPVIVALVVIMALIGIANLSSLLRGNKRAASASAMPMRPAAPNAQEVNSFETQQE